ncbi:ABC transporter permease [Stella sp.]|uniref:ABC transporter permease n=1 Tax=Stella sp. TaxID=2912054 RepID=UPI0035AF751C
MGAFLGYLWRTRNLAAAVAALIVAAFVVVAVGAPLFADWGAATKVELQHALALPSAEFPLGADELGRDLLARLVWGARISLGVAVVSVGFALAAGVCIGAACGYYEGRVAELVMRSMDFLIAFPRILLAIMLITVLGTGVVSLTLAIGISSIPVYARLFRAPVLTLKQREFVLAARSLGARDGTILFGHILPNTVSLMIIQGTISLADAILIASGLSFLGLGPQPPTPEWGAMIANARAHITSTPHVVFAPGLALFAVILGLNVLGDALRDFADPRVRKSR